jgi:diadenosine tetraphosphate (Ap4A) HIT family hydrolase
VSEQIGSADWKAPVNEHDQCLLCAAEDVDEGSVIFRDDLWAAELIAGYDVPGWVILRARRHAERITGLDHGELDTLGHRARDLVAAVSQVAGAPATYLLVFGENYPHFHALIAPRGADVPAERRAGDILKLRAERADPVAARQLVPALRTAYAEAADRPLQPR